jgi:hypothetical protein
MRLFSTFSKIGRFPVEWYKNVAFSVLERDDINWCSAAGGDRSVSDIVHGHGVVSVVSIAIRYRQNIWRRIW